MLCVCGIKLSDNYDAALRNRIQYQFLLFDFTLQKLLLFFYSRLQSL